MGQPFAVFQRATVARRDVRLDTSLELLLEQAPITPRCVLATVVSTAGSTYRKSGARMLILSDGNYLGLLSGGCFESDLTEHARGVMDSGTARALEYDMRGPDDELFGVGAGCEGALRVLLEPAGADSRTATALVAAASSVEEGRATALIMVHESAQLPLGTYCAHDDLPERVSAAVRAALIEASSRSLDTTVDGRRERIFIQYLAPAPHLLILGGAPDARLVAAAARSLGWKVTVVEHRPAYAVHARFPGATVIRAEPKDLAKVVNLDTCHAAVVMSHHLKSDEQYLSVLAAADRPGFVGLLGPTARRARLLHEVGASASQLDGRLRGPVGIDIGAMTPESIALSVTAQIHAWLAGREIS